MQRLVTLFLIIVPFSFVSIAQEKGVSRFTLSPDTTYIVRYPFRYTIRPNVGTSFGQFSTSWTGTETDYSYSLMSVPIFKMGCNVSFRGITAGIHRDVKRLFGETEETEYSVSGYCPFVGGELAYSSAHTHTMSSHAEEGEWQAPLEGCHTRRFQGNGYVVLNPRRYSLPATTTQRYSQLRSAGSPIVGVSVIGFRMDVDPHQLPPSLTAEDTPYDYAQHILYTTASIGAGYGYNWVLEDNWMLHATYLHYLSLWHYGEIAFTDSTLPLGHKVNQSGLVRIGSVWDVARYFAGFTGTMQMQWMSFSPIRTFDFYVNTQLFFGFRF